MDSDLIGSPHPAPAEALHVLDLWLGRGRGGGFLQQQYLEVPQPEPGRVGNLVIMVAQQPRQHVAHGLLEF